MRLILLIAMCIAGFTSDGQVPGDPPHVERHATRVAVLNIGHDGAGRAGQKGLAITSASFPISALVQAADELRDAKADVVVLKINAEGACGTDGFVTAVETVFRPRFRTVGWVVEAINEGGVAAVALPEICMTPEAYLGNATCHIWNHKTCGEFAKHAAAVGGRPVELVQALVDWRLLSTSVIDGKRVYRHDATGEVVIAAAERGMNLNAERAVKCGVSIGTAGTREELARVLGLTDVEWIGDDVDARLQSRCDAAARGLERVRELLTQVFLSSDALSTKLTTTRRVQEGAKRDFAWAEIQTIRSAWPGLAELWPPLLSTREAWGANWDATWGSLAQEAGMERVDKKER